MSKTVSRTMIRDGDSDQRQRQATANSEQRQGTAVSDRRQRSRLQATQWPPSGRSTEGAATPACGYGHERPGGDHVPSRHEHQPRCPLESPRSSGNRDQARDEGSRPVKRDADYCSLTLKTDRCSLSLSLDTVAAAAFRDRERAYRQRICQQPTRTPRVVRWETSSNDLFRTAVIGNEETGVSDFGFLNDTLTKGSDFDCSGPGKEARRKRATG